MSLFTKSAYRTANSILRTSPNIYTKNFIRSFQTTTAKMGVHNIADKAHFDEVIKDNKVVILDAYATWCGPCKVIAPQVAKFAEDFPKAKFVKLDVDEVPDVAQELGIRAMPTFVIFKDGDIAQTIVGANPKALLAAIETYAEK